MPAIVVVGLGFGDEGKGAVVDHLVREHNASGVVLFNGGAQRAHNVVLPGGTHHTCSQFSSGTLAGKMTWHSKYSLVNPHAFFNEGQKIEKAAGFHPWNMVAVQEDAIITTPFHVALNRLRETVRQRMTGSGHGTCGMGIGETVMDDMNGYAIYAKDLKDPKLLYEKLHDAQRRLRKEAHTVCAQLNSRTWVTDPAFFEYAAIADCMEIYRIFAKVVPQFDEFSWDSDETYIFEGSQGALLDAKNGFHPHTTWSNTSKANALDLLRGYEGDIKTIGVMRSYITRHGAGPFPTEDPALVERFPEAHNGSEGWQGSWRVGWTDLAAIRRGIEINKGVDELAVTHLDSVRGDWKICLGYGYDIPLPLSGDRNEWERMQGRILALVNSGVKDYLEFDDMDADAFLGWIEAYLHTPVTITGSGPTHADYSSVVPV
jgi:adenylosuccinate synthase